MTLVVCFLLNLKPEVWVSLVISVILLAAYHISVPFWIPVWLQGIVLQGSLWQYSSCHFAFLATEQATIFLVLDSYSFKIPELPAKISWLQWRFSNVPKVACQHIDEDQNFMQRMCLKSLCFNSLWKGRSWLHCENASRVVITQPCSQILGQTEYLEGQGWFSLYWGVTSPNRLWELGIGCPKVG